MSLIEPVRLHCTVLVELECIAYIATSLLTGQGYVRELLGWVLE
jgi:hypothetical protein